MLLSQSEYLIATPVGAVIFFIWLFLVIVPRLVRREEHKAVVKHYGGPERYNEMIRTEAAALEHKRRTVKYLMASCRRTRAEVVAEAEAEDNRRRHIIFEDEYNRRQRGGGVLVGQDIPPVPGSPADPEQVEKHADFYAARERLRQQRQEATGHATPPRGTANNESPVASPSAAIFRFCTQCGTAASGKKFCTECGAQTAAG